MTADTTLCRLELLCKDGWWIAHHGVNLLHPERYPVRLADKGKFGRVTELGSDLQPTGRVHVTPGVPPALNDKRSAHGSTHLVSGAQNGSQRPGPTKTCPHCQGGHPGPYDGMCLL